MKSFEVKSGKLVVSDPCYSKDTWCQIILENVRNGKWNAVAEVNNQGTFGNRVARLRANTPVDVVHIEKYSGEVGVDSGQAGICDYDAFGWGEGELDDNESFYGAVCNITLNNSHGIYNNAGVFSQSGFGDGGYPCYVGYDKDGKVCFVEIVFIGDENEQDEHDDEDY